MEPSNSDDAGMSPSGLGLPTLDAADLYSQIGNLMGGLFSGGDGDGLPTETPQNTPVFPSISSAMIKNLIERKLQPQLDMMSLEDTPEGTSLLTDDSPVREEHLHSGQTHPEEEEEEEEVSDSYESESEEKDPLLLLIESKVAQMLGAPSGYIEELPEEAQDSLKELSLLQDKINQQHDAMIIRRAAHAHTFESRSKELDIEALQEVSKSPGGLSAFWTNAFGVFHRRGEFNVSTADLQILRFLLDVRGGVVLERPGDDLGDRRYVECQFATNPFFSRSHLRVEYDDKSAETSRVDWRRQDPTKVGLLARLGDGQSFFDLFQPDDGEEALSSLLDMAESVRLRIVSRAISAWFEREEQE